VVNDILHKISPVLRPIIATVKIFYVENIGLKDAFAQGHEESSTSSKLFLFPFFPVLACSLSSDFVVYFCTLILGVFVTNGCENAPVSIAVFVHLPVCAPGLQ
jgi:hypothetical protein